MDSYSEVRRVREQMSEGWARYPKADRRHQRASWPASSHASSILAQRQNNAMHRNRRGFPVMRRMK